MPGTRFYSRLTLGLVFGSHDQRLSLDAWVEFVLMTTLRWRAYDLAIWQFTVANTLPAVASS